MRRWAVFVLLLTAVPAAAEDDVFLRWRRAGPDERRRLQPELDRVTRARRFGDARPVLIDYEKRTWTLAQLFSELLDPALRLATMPESDRDPGLTELHRRALGAFGPLREAYAPPRPVRSGTVNLLLAYAYAALRADALTPAARLRFFAEAARNVRDFDGRVTPDARTEFLFHERILPRLLRLADRAEEPADKKRITDAASLLYLPGLLDDRGQATLATVTAGQQTRGLLARFYRQGMLDAAGRRALAQSVAIQTRDDPAFAAGAAPLLLELLADPLLPPADRGVLADAVLDGLAPVAALHAAARDLLAVAVGAPPRPLDEARAARKRGKPLDRADGGRAFRFLRIVLLQERADRPPVVQRVERADLPYYDALHAGTGATRRFAGVLVPDATGRHADFLGPPPGIASARDNRLLRRTLQLERIAIRTYGPRHEEIELCVALPDDESEPVPGRGAGVSHVLSLVDARLQLTTDPVERAELIALLVRFRTDAAATLAVDHARTPATVRALMPLAERGHGGAARRLLDEAASFGFEEQERVFAAAIDSGAADAKARVKELCRDPNPAVAALAADALLASGDATGLPALFAHPNRYARACAAALAVRLTKLAGALRIVPRKGVEPAVLARHARDAFAKEAAPWNKLGSWVSLALTDPDKAAGRRRTHKELYLGRRRVLPMEFADAYAEAVRAGKVEKRWPGLTVFLLDPFDPGAGIPERALEPLLDALEAQAKNGALRETWRDALVVLVCVQYGLDMQTEWLDLAHKRLTRLAGKRPPPAARRKAGLYWALWAAQESAR